MFTSFQKSKLRIKTFTWPQVSYEPKFDIVEIYTSLTGNTVRRTGRVTMGKCPFHEENTPSFAMYEDTGSYYCFGCGKSGKAKWLKHELEKL